MKLHPIFAFSKKSCRYIFLLETNKKFEKKMEIQDFY